MIQRDNIYLLLQMIGMLEEAAAKLERAKNENDSGLINKSKDNLLAFCSKINEMLT